MRTDIFADVTERRNQVLWLSLAFQGGFMNAGGFLACHRFVSHVTGYGTHVGVALGREEYLGAFEMACPRSSSSRARPIPAGSSIGGRSWAGSRRSWPGSSRWPS